MLMTHAMEPDSIRPGFDVTLLPQRNYDTTLGRFTSFDTFEGETTNPITLNHYIYAGADPVDNIDPTGHTTMQEGQAAHKIIGAIYQFDHPGSLVDFSIKPYSGGKKLLADIINYTGSNINTGLLAEIKTPGEAALGDTQLQGYVNAYNSAHVANKAWARDSGWDPSVKFFWLGAADPSLAKTFGVIIGNFNGVIVYQTFTPPSPPPVPIPIPDPVIETITREIYSGLEIARDVIYETILVGAALGGARALISKAIPAIAAYVELGESTTVVTSLA